MDGLRVLVTRPLAQARPWVAALRAAGLDAHALPLIGIEPVADPRPVVAAWGALAQDALVMFVSANAVEHFFAHRPGGIDWPAGTLAGSTGPGTTAALRRAGVPGECIVEPLPGAPYDSESLWERLRNRPWAGQRVCVVRGEDGRDWLADQLRAAGATVRPVAAYRRVVARLDAAELALLSSALATPANCCWIFSSSEAVGNLRRLAPGLDPAASVALASHPRIAQAAREAGFVDVRLVAPQTDAVVAALRPAQERAA